MNKLGIDIYAHQAHVPTTSPTIVPLIVLFSHLDRFSGNPHDAFQIDWKALVEWSNRWTNEHHAQVILLHASGITKVDQKICDIAQANSIPSLSFLAAGTSRISEVNLLIQICATNNLERVGIFPASSSILPHWSAYDRLTQAQAEAEGCVYPTRGIGQVPVILTKEAIHQIAEYTKYSISTEDFWNVIDRAASFLNPKRIEIPANEGGSIPLFGKRCGLPLDKTKLKFTGELPPEGVDYWFFHYSTRMVGAWIATRNLMNGLKKLGQSVTVTFPSSEFTGMFSQASYLPGTFMGLHEDLASNAAYTEIVYKQLSQTKPKRVVASNPNLALATACKMLKIPIALIAHAPLFRYLDLITSISKMGLGMYDHIFFPSESAYQEALRAGLSQSLCRQMSLGIDTDYFRPPTDKEKQEARKQFEISDNTFAVMYVAVINPVKQQAFAIHTLSYMLNKNLLRPPHLYFIGHGDNDISYRAELNALASTLGVNNYVHFIDWIEDIRIAYWAADSHIQCGVDETFGLALAESMSCEVPTVARGDSGLASKIVSGVNGYRVNASKSPEDLADTLKLITLAKPNRVLLQAERDLIVQNFSISTIAGYFNKDW